MELDPRVDIIEKRLSGLQRILAVTGGKGGIGKSLVASGLALALAESGCRVGLLDLDFTGPCDHLILGIHGPFPEEKFGLVPPEVHGIRFMSITHFVGEQPAPLRGQDLSNALIELLCITQWGNTHTLVVDMPPGLGDAALDAVRLMPAAEFLAVSTRSRVVLETVARTLRLLQRMDAHILGLLENMARDDSPAVQELATTFQIPWLGSLPFDETVEDALGNVDKLGETPFLHTLRHLVRSRL
ncbi:MAG: P-loop NTPase [bacterium]|nr:P-loop NTPase [bacterium]